MKQCKSTLPYYKIKIKLPELGEGQTRQPWPCELDMWYAMILMQHLQRFSFSRMQSSNPLKCAWPPVNMTRWREEKGSQVNQGNTLSSDVGYFRENKTHCRQRADMGLPGTDAWPLWMGWDPHNPQTQHQGSHDPWLGRTVSAASAPKVKTSGFL